MSDAAIVYSILAAAVALFAWNRLPVEIVAIATALSLAATGVLTTDQALAGFGDPTIVFIASLFVVSAALDATGVTTWAGQQLIRFADDKPGRLLVSTMLLSALLTSIISVNGAVAALIPMVVVVAVRMSMPTSKLMMPLAFAAHAGSMLALTGTPVNVLVSDAAHGAGVGRFGYFEFALVGVPLLAIVITITVLAGDRLLPDRTPSSLPPDLSEHARTLGAAYLDERDVYRYDVPAASEVVGRSIEDARSRVPDEVEIIGVEEGSGGVDGSATMQPGDVLIVRGPAHAVEPLARRFSLTPRPKPFPRDDALVTKRLGVVEFVVPPRSTMIGETVFPGMVTDSGDLVVLAVQRQGQDRGPRPVRLAAGDALLVQGEWSDLEREARQDREVLAVDDPVHLRSQAVPLGPRSREAIVVTIVMVVLLATGAVPAAVAGLLAASAMVLLRVLSTTQAYRGISWSTVLLVGGMIPVSTAMKVSGAADDAAKLLVDLTGGHDPRFLLLGIFLLSAVVGSVISNTATALILIPVALAASETLGVPAKPALMAVAVSTSAAFLLPITTPANLMVMGPGDYRFGDYWKFGLPILAAYGLVVVFYIPLIWRL